VLGKTTGSASAYPIIAAVKGISEADAPGLFGVSARGTGVVGFGGGLRSPIGRDMDES